MTGSLGDTAIDKVMESFQRRGYQVSRSFKKEMLPPPLRPFEFDFLAVKGDDRVIVEIKTRTTLTSGSQLSELAAVASETGYRLELIVDEPDPPATPRRVIEERAGQAIVLLAEGYVEPAFLMAWSAVEGALWTISKRYIISADRTGLHNLSRLFSNGILSEEQFELLRRATPLRNQLVHGLVGESLPSELIRGLASLAKWLANPDFVPVGEMVDWFLDAYEDPVHHMPHDSREGGYQYTQGGPYDARTELGERYPEAREEDIEEAARIVESESPEWVKKGGY